MRVYGIAWEGGVVFVLYIFVGCLTKSFVPMELVLERKWLKSGYTIGNLYVNGRKFSNVLEDEDRGLRQDMGLDEIDRIKIKGKTAIPVGKYSVGWTWSPRFGRYLPILYNVPGYEGVRIHSGNDAGDTEGCLLPGKNDKVGWVSNSRQYCNELFPQIERAIKRGERVMIEIRY